MSRRAHRERTSRHAGWSGRAGRAWARSLVVGAALAAMPIGVQALEAQAPGGDGRPAADIARARYKARLVEELTERMRDWADAWNQDDLDRLAGFYADDAVLRPPRSGALRGKEVITRYLELALPIAGEIQTGLTDVEGSGRLAYLTGRWQHIHEGQVFDGNYVIVVEMARQWRIRGQYFVAGPDSEAPGLPALGAGGSEFTAVDLSGEVPEIRGLLDRMSGAWLSRDPVRMAGLWSEEMLYAAEGGERAFGRTPALDLWSERLSEGEGVQDVVLDFAWSERFAFAFVQRIRTWREGDLARTRQEPATMVFYRTDRGWELRSLVLLVD